MINKDPSSFGIEVQAPPFRDLKHTIKGQLTEGDPIAHRPTGKAATWLEIRVSRPDASGKNGGELVTDG